MRLFYSVIELFFASFNVSDQFNVIIHRILKVEYLEYELLRDLLNVIHFSPSC